MDKDARSIRLDVYVKDNKDTIYNIEMQVADTGNIEKRSRYYQSMIDLQLIHKNESYQNLNTSYVIFICPFDLFKAGRHIYTFKNLCEEDTGIQLNDGTTKIFLNTKGQIDDVSEDLKAFLDYVEGKPSDNDFVRKLEEEIREAKKNREWRHEYMTLLMRDQENLQKGIDQGKIYGAISTFKQLGLSEEVIIKKLHEMFQLTEIESKAYIEES